MVFDVLYQVFFALVFVWLMAHLWWLFGSSQARSDGDTASMQDDDRSVLQSHDEPAKFESRLFDRRWLARALGDEVRWPSEVAEALSANEGQPGVVLVFRYGNKSAFGMMPDHAWREASVTIDGRSAATGSVLANKVVWVPLGDGRHRLALDSFPSGQPLGDAEFEVNGRPVVVAVTPRRRRGVMPGFVQPRVDVYNDSRT